MNSTVFKDIKAETLLAQMDLPADPEVCMQGIFSRNYSEDLICVRNEEGKAVVELSRDGVFHLLPEGLFFEENRIKDIPNNDFEPGYTRFKEEKEYVKSFFRVFDQLYFKQTLEMEKKLNILAEKGNRIFLGEFLDERELDSDNEYISKIKTILPFVSLLRGNLALLTELLKEILAVNKVELKKTKPFCMQFIIHREGLSKEEYLSMDKNMAAFFVFFCQWFLPVEMKFNYRIKDYTNPFRLGNTLLLDYNTHL